MGLASTVYCEQEKKRRRDRSEETEKLNRMRADRKTYVPPSDEVGLKIFAGSANRPLAQEIASRLGVQLGRCRTGQFKDGETRVEIHDNVRGKDVYIIQPTSNPANDNLMELLLMVSAMRRASAERIVAIIPYYAYARQLDRNRHRSTIAGADVALMLEAVGVDHVIAVDLHRSQVEGFFSNETPLDNVDTVSSALPYFLRKNLKSPVVVSPCGDGVGRAKSFRDKLTKAGNPCGFALLSAENDKGFVDMDENHHQEMRNTLQLVGDVDDCDVIVVDDMIDTGSRMIKSAETLKKNGARRVFCYATHGLFSGNCIAGIHKSNIDEVVVFNTIPLRSDQFHPNIRQLSCGALLAEVIKTLHLDRDLFEIDNDA